MHINNRDKWIYEVTFSRNFGGTISKISWDRLVQEVSKRKPSQIKEVTFYYPDMPGGTMQIPGNLDVDPLAASRSCKVPEKFKLRHYQEIGDVLSLRGLFGSARTLLFIKNLTSFERFLGSYPLDYRKRGL